MSGALEILNVGLGDLKLTFNKHSEAERARAQRTIEKLLREGYAILIERGDGTYQRAHGFDPEQDAYVLMEPTEDRPPTADDVEPQPEKKRGRPRKTLVKREEARATAVARSAGG